MVSAAMDQWVALGISEVVLWGIVSHCCPGYPPTQVISNQYLIKGIFDFWMLWCDDLYNLWRPFSMAFRWVLQWVVSTYEWMNGCIDM